MGSIDDRHAVTFGVFAAGIASSVIAGFLAADPVAPPPRYMTIVTASASGTYHGIGREICSLVNDPDSDLRCIAAPSRGSAMNIDLMRSPIRRVEAGLVQSDRLHESGGGGDLVALSGESGGPPLALAQEALFVLVRRDDAVDSLSALIASAPDAARLALDLEGSGTRDFALQVLGAVGLVPDEALLPAIAPIDYPSALCDDRIDAGFWIVSNRRLLPATGRSQGGMAPPCDLSLVPLSPDLLARAFDEDRRALYRPARIHLEGCVEGVESFGPVAHLVTPRTILDTRPEDVRRLVTAAVAVLAMDENDRACNGG